MTKENKLRKEIETSINKYSMENGSDTPDFILAEFMTDCLRAFNRATVKRNKWYEPQAEKEHNVDRQYTIDEVMRCVEHWGLCKVEKEYIEKFLNEPQTDKEL